MYVVVEFSVEDVLIHRTRGILEKMDSTEIENLSQADTDKRARIVVVQNSFTQDSVSQRVKK